VLFFVIVRYVCKDFLLITFSYSGVR